MRSEDARRPYFKSLRAVAQKLYEDYIACLVSEAGLQHTRRNSAVKPRVLGRMATTSQRGEKHNLKIDSGNSRPGAVAIDIEEPGGCSLRP